MAWSMLSLAQRFAPSIHQCPRLAPRDKPPTGVNDLRPDDIGVIAAIGDSIMAGFIARGVNASTPYVTLSQYTEDRGVSFAIGGDRDAVTLPNILEHYAGAGLQGASVGTRPPQICEDELWSLCIGTEHHGDDHFNAAQSGATSLNFTQQVQYLIERIGRGTSFDDEWKILTIFLGSNDVVLACLPGYSAAEYEQRMREGLSLLKQNLNKVFINLIAPSPANANDLLKHTLDLSYVKPTVPPNPGYDLFICPCCYEIPAIDVLGTPVSPLGQATMTLASTAFGLSIKKLANEFADTSPNATFTVTYQNMYSIPTSPRYISNIDGYHASKLGHAYGAKLLWNNMFRKEALRPLMTVEHEGELVRCPTESDRFQA
ncbi:hypothetical protein BCR43DRAFT_518886 [Syncephalastrum racemosum]|uniref:SGNH hydrolase-type esterase domain-containing protein n=1 Tax=Syncephalastrum racemosum TaxID=13706 RepID=A0A1X2H023_SYNRA|nr:hypothetical protein BCR43DRAFT_518886 [Syncephalastrum racemosum]